MSMMLMVKAMNIKVGNPLRKLVLIKLADNANDMGECWPSYQHIADQCEISRRSVINHMNDLEKAGYLVKQHRKGTHKANSSNLYILRLDGAGATPPLVQEIHHPSAGATPPPSAGAAPRTSHSFEPVIEPKPLSRSLDDDLEKVVANAAVQTPNGKTWGTADDLEIARLMANDIVKLAGGTESDKTDQQLCRWANDVRLLRGKKTNSGKPITHEHIRALWTFANQDAFWCINILSPKKLSQQWETLVIKRIQENKTGASNHAKHQQNYVMSAQETAEYLAAEQQKQQFGEHSGNIFEHDDGC